jgi:hypothetical protein
MRLAKFHPIAGTLFEFMTDDEITLARRIQELERALAVATGTPTPTLREPTAAIVEPAVEQPKPAADAVEAAAPGGAKDAAGEFLATFLAAGPRSAIEVTTAAAERGISETTLKRAKQDLGIISKKVGLMGWQWALPVDGEQAAEPGEVEASAT